MKLDKKRKQERKTNYNKRLRLLESSNPRLVVRKTNKYLIIQIVESNKAQDRILFSFNTKELLKNGWPENKRNSLKSITAGYLGGWLLGKKIKEVEEVILDTGLIPSTKGSRIYSAVKGLSDSGIKINYGDEIIPSEDRISGNHIKFDLELFNKIKEKVQND